MKKQLNSTSTQFADEISRLKAELAACQASAAQYRLILDHTGEIIYMIAASNGQFFGGMTQFVSKPVEGIIGYTPEDFTSHPDLWIRLMHPDDIAVVQQATALGVASRTAFVREYRLKDSRTGEYYWMADKVVPQFDDQGNLIALLGVVRDITAERKEVSADEAHSHQHLEVYVEGRTKEQARIEPASARQIVQQEQTPAQLQVEKEFLEYILETAQAIMLVLDPKGRIVYFNRFLEELSGYRLGEVNGQDWFATFLPRRDRPRIRQLFKHAIGDKPTRGNVNSILTRSGEERIVEWYDKTLIDASGIISGLLAIGIDITERVKAEHASESYRRQLEQMVDTRTQELELASAQLLEREARLQAIVSNVPLILFSIDRKGIFTLSEGRGLESLGLKPGQAVGMSVFEMYQDVPEVKGYIRRALKGEDVSSTVEARGLAYEFRYLPSRDRRGHVTGIDGYALDVSERVFAQKALQKNEQRLRAQFWNFPLPTYLWRVEGDDFILVDYNALADAAGHGKLSDALGSQVSDIYRTAPEILRGFARCLETHSTINLETESPLPFTDELRIIRLNFVFIPSDLIQVHIEDITEFKHAEDALRENESRLRTILDATDDVIFLINTSGTILASNKAFNQRFTSSGDGLTRMNIYDQLPPGAAARRRAFADQVITTGKPFRFQDTNNGRDSDTGAYPIFDQQGKVMSVVITARDITEQKRVEEELRRSREEAIRSQRLLFALSQASKSIQYALTPNEVYRAIGEEVAKLGHRVNIFLLSDDREYLWLPHTTLERGLVGKAERLTGLKLEDFRIPLVQGNLFRQLIDERKPRFFESNIPVIEAALPRPLRYLAKQVGNLVKVRQTISAPLYSGDEFLGLLDVTGEGLTETDMPAVGVFASQMAIAIRNAQLMENLHREQGRLAEAQQIAHMGNWDWNIETNGLWWSDEIYRIFGLEPQQFGAAYDAFLQTVHPDDRTYVQKSVDAALYEDRRYSIDHRIVLPDGTVRVVYEQAKVVFNGTGKPIRMVGTVQDITERKQTEEELRKLSAAVEQSASAIMITNMDGIIEYANPKFVEMTGFTRDEVLGQTPRMLKSGETPSEVYNSMWTVILAGEQWRGEMLNKRKNGELFWAREQISPIKDSNGEITHFVAVEEDITEQRHAETLLRESEARYRDLFHGVPVGLYRTTADGRWLQVNATFAKILGYPDLDTLLKTDVARSYLSPKARRQWQLKLTQADILTDYEEQMRRYDGTPIWTSDTARAVYDDDGTLLYYEGSVQDVTERRRIEQAEHEQRLFTEALLDATSAISSTLDLNSVLDRLLQSIRGAVPYDEASIMLCKSGSARIAHRKSYSRRAELQDTTDIEMEISETPTLNTMAHTGGPLVIPDVKLYPGWRQFGAISKWVRSYIGAPIVLNREVMGFVNLDAALPNAFTIDDAARLNAFAGQAALAIHNARLYEAERHERLAASTLRKTAEALAASIRLEDTLETVLDQLEQIVSCDLATIALTEADSLRAVAARGFTHPDKIYQQLIPYSELPLIKEILLGGELVAIRDAQADSRWDPRIAYGMSVRSWIGVPLVASGVPVGMLILAGHKPEMFSADDQETIRAFAQQVAVAIRNANIVTHLEDSLARLREAQDQLRRTARLSAAGEIAAGVAHQINNPLTAIIGRVQILKHVLDPLGKAYTSVEIIERAAYRAAGVVQRMLDLARARDYVIKPVNINDSLQSAISLIRTQIESGRVHLEIELASALPLVEASDEHLQDVWLNLLINAKDAVSSLARISTIRVITRPGANNTVEIMIEDTGPGVPAQELETIFTPFFTTKEHGTGLGLAIVHETITRHGGSIQVESQEGHGTRFTIVLPAARDQQRT